MSRSRDDFDDDDYDGYNRAQGGGGNARVLARVIGAVVVLAIVAGVLVLYVWRVRRAEVAIEHARVNAARVEAARDAIRARPMAAPPDIWPRMIGKWSRTPEANEKGRFPVEFEFHRDMTAKLVTQSPDGPPAEQNATVEILSHDNDSARLKLKVPMGAYGYKFSISQDGTLTLDDGKGGLNFTRGK